MQKKSTGWGWIIFWIIIFWPVGVFLMVKKFSSDKSALMSGKTSSLFVPGCILIVFGILFFASLPSYEDKSIIPTAIVCGILFIVGGAFMLYKVSTIKKTAKKYKAYIEMIVNQNVRNIDSIASAVGVSYDVAVKNLQDMINIGYLKDAYINHGNREISLKQQETVIPTQEMVDGQTLTRTTVHCPGCGANNVAIVGRISECEYCGNPISA